VGGKRGHIVDGDLLWFFPVAGVGRIPTCSVYIFIPKNRAGVSSYSCKTPVKWLPKLVIHSTLTDDDGDDAYTRNARPAFFFCNARVRTWNFFVS
jgi:hypothetical protein